MAALSQPIVYPVIEHNCTSGIVACYISLENAGVVQRIIAYALLFFAAVPLIISLVGNILLFKCVEEYTAQTLEAEFYRLNPNPSPLRTPEQIEQLQKAGEEAAQKVINLEAAMRGLTDERDALRRGTPNLDAQIDALNTQILQMSATGETAQTRITELDTQLQAALVARNAAAQRILELEATLGTTTEERDAARAEVTALNAQITNLQQQIQTLTEAGTSAQAQHQPS